MWDAVDTNKTVGALWPNDPDGNAFDAPKTGFPDVVRRTGTRSPIRSLRERHQDFTAQISEFKETDVEILTGVPIPPDFTTFWKQAAQQGFPPKFVTVAKALLPRPSSTRSATSGRTSPPRCGGRRRTLQQLAHRPDRAAARRRVHGADRQAADPVVGFVHALFEVAATTPRRADRTGRRKASEDPVPPKTDTVVGPLDWTSGPVPTSPRPRWSAASGGGTPTSSYSLVVVSNKENPEIPLGGKVEPLR